MYMKVLDMLTSEDIKRIKAESHSTKRIEQLEVENKKLKKKAQEAEGENTIIKGIGNNSPEMKALQKEIEEVKAELAREKEDHQYDNLVHQKEVKELNKK